MTKTEISKIAIEIGGKYIDEYDKVCEKYNKLLNSDSYHPKEWANRLNDLSLEKLIINTKIDTIDEILKFARENLL